MKIVPSFLSAELARTDIANLSRTLYDLQRQSASGFRATDLKGFGEDNRQILSTRGEIQRLEARLANADRAETRLGVQGFALEQASESMKTFREQTLRALTQDDGRFLHIEVDTAFRMVQSALNQNFGGQFLFSGERSDETPIRARTMQELVDLPSDSEIFTSSPREAVLDIGDGEPTPVAEQAKVFARTSLIAMRELQRDLNQEGGTFSAPLTQDQRARLSRIVELIDKGFSDFVAAQGRNGALQSRLDADRDRLNNRIDFLSAEVGQAADADLAEVAMRMSAVQTQYQAAARVFAQISELSVLNFLR